MKPKELTAPGRPHINGPVTPPKAQVTEKLKSQTKTSMQPSFFPAAKDLKKTDVKKYVIISESVNPSLKFNEMLDGVLRLLLEEDMRHMVGHGEQ